MAGAKIFRFAARHWARTARSSSSPLLFVCLVLLAGLILSGCSGSPPPTPVPPAVLDAIVAYFVTQKSLSFAGGRTAARRQQNKLDRHKGFFVRRRAMSLGATHASWIAESNQVTLKARIDSEYQQIDAFVTAKTASTGPLGGGTDPPPAHLDLNDVAQVLTTTPTSVVRWRAGQYLQMRKNAVAAICWRGAGLFDAYWQPSAGDQTATLNADALNETLDRRLRTIERMHHQVSSAHALVVTSGSPEGGTGLTGTNPIGPWTDRFRVRMFEYPRLAGGYASLAGAANIAEVNDPDPAYPTQPRLWKWETARHRRLHWNQWNPGQATKQSSRFATPSQPHWTPASVGDLAGYAYNLTPNAISGSQAIDLLFTPSTDWWGRSWMFCDHVLSALHIEALRFGLSRRATPRGSDATFDTLVSGSAAGFVALSPFVGGRTDHQLMGGGAGDDYFDNLSGATALPETDLQVGDHVILWNSLIYSLISSAEWRLENSLVMDIDSDPATGGINRDNLELQGHGIDKRTYARYLQGIADYLGEGLADAREALRARYAADPGVTQFVWSAHGSTIIRWDPYPADNFVSLITGAGGSVRQRANGAWWVIVPLRTLNTGSVTAALQMVPKSVTDDSAPGPGYSTIPPLAEPSVLFPLFEPAVSAPTGDKWAAYFALRRSGSGTRVGTGLREVRADRTLAAGLFPSGVPGTPIALVRPRVTP
jgi:hypothetical protein